ncbi:hypothetical protein V6N12_045999 [Hibiscus sabdariffa]|uniref:Retrotransposon gag domain-containing protein n=1 Tax=Hibiscus sabdariffa TaxID=183260 RepID=A0ABR2G4A6_9ROSI
MENSGDLEYNEAKYRQNVNAALRQIVRAIPKSQPETLVERLRRYPTRFFRGSDAEGPIGADNWLRETQRTLKRMHLTNEDKLECATVLLTDDAINWWETVEVAMHPVVPTWNFFLTNERSEFRDGLHPGIFVYMAGDKDADFLELTRKPKEFERGNWLKKTAEAGVQNLRIGNSTSSSRTSSKRFRNSRDLGRNLSAQSQRSTGSFAQRRQFPSSSMPPRNLVNPPRTRKSKEIFEEPRKVLFCGLYKASKFLWLVRASTSFIKEFQHFNQSTA